MLDLDILHFRPQVGERRLGSLIPIRTRWLQTVIAGAGAKVDEWQFQAVPAMEPIIGPAEGSQVFLFVAHAKRGQRGFRHGGGLHGLLVVRSLILSVGIPAVAPDRPKSVCGGSFPVQGGERSLRHFYERLPLPTP